MTDRLFLQGPQNLLAITVNGSVIVESEEERQRSETACAFLLFVVDRRYHISMMDLEMKVTEIILAKVSRLSQLLSYARGFLSRLKIFKFIGPSLWFSLAQDTMIQKCF